MKSKRMVSAYVVCPFYRDEDKQMIRCEGLERDTSIHLAFASHDQLRDYKHRYCNLQYGACRIAQMLEGKYESE